MSPPEPATLRRLLDAAQAPPDAVFAEAGVAARHSDAATGTVLAGRARELAGRSILMRVKSQLTSALALIELDGVVSRLTICPPDFTAERIGSAIVQAQVDAVVCDADEMEFGAGVERFEVAPLAVSDAAEDAAPVVTEWALPTSGTTGAPKLVAHRLSGLLGAIRPQEPGAPAPVWATFYDIRRYGGLQVFLRAASGGATLVLSTEGEPLVEHVERMRAAGATHVVGTPSHWRRLLMSPHANRIAPEYVRLSGEIVDRAVLEALKTTYPAARIVHAYATTEAGVGFEVADGAEGFPASFVCGLADVELRVVDGSLHVRSARAASRYVGQGDIRLVGDDGFVDTDDMVERRGERYVFKGRRAGVINVGGLKVHPEEVEQVIALHEHVRMALVKARRSPIVGDIIVADVVLKDAAPTPSERAALRDDILAHCRARLERHQAPAVVNFVQSLDMHAGGKLARR